MSDRSGGAGTGRGLDRRRFLTRAALLLGGAAGAAPLVRPGAVLAADAPPRPFEALGVQLYTLRTLMAESVPATLDAVAEIGYREVELAGLFDLAPAEFRALLDARGLRAPSTHIGLDGLMPDTLATTLDTAATLGHEWVVVPSLGRDQLSPEGLPAVIEQLERAGEAARERGIGIGFHNHAAEFDAWPDGRLPLQVMVEGTSPERVSFQLDLFWTVHAGRGPLEVLGWMPGRCVSVHVKDRTANGDMVPVGDGVIDFATLLPEAARLGVRHAFVEHDRPADPRDAVARSYGHLRSILD